jgi:hypothetical protein
MGMNNGDKNGVLSTSYVNCTLEVLELCKQHGIEAILSTIPTCIAVENGPKNNEILYKIGRFADYDYRIIDFARAVDGYQPQSSATWYEGMLYSDNVHPDIRGAKALYMQFMHDFPEIIAGCEIDVAENKNETLNADETLTIVPNGPVGEQKVITFTADYSSFSGFSIGNGAGVEGGTWVEITESKVAVYTMQNGVKVELAQEVNSLVMEDLVTVIIHVDGTSAKICVQGTGEKDFESSKTKNVIFNVKSTWSFAGDVFVSADEGQNFENASLKWYSFDK